jgi:hypothetical protein
VFWQNQITSLCAIRNFCSLSFVGALLGDAITGKSVPWLRRLVAALPPRRPGFDPGSVHVEFVVEKVALGQVFPQVLRFYPVNFIPPELHYLEKDKK